jgi:hypothetical protein
MGLMVVAPDALDAPTATRAADATRAVDRTSQVLEFRSRIMAER